MLDTEATMFFVQLVKSSIGERRKDGIRRNDLIDLVIDVMEKESIKKDTLEDQYDGDAVLKDFNPQKPQWTDQELETVLVSNALMTLMAGFTQVSSASSKILYHLAKNPHIQEKLYQEVFGKVQEVGTDRLDYASIMALPYLDMIFHENLRHFSEFGHLGRVASKDYHIPDTNVTIQKGTTTEDTNTWNHA